MAPPLHTPKRAGQEPERVTPAEGMVTSAQSTAESHNTSETTDGRTQRFIGTAPDVILHEEVELQSALLVHSDPLSLQLPIAKQRKVPAGEILEHSASDAQILLVTCAVK